MSFLKKSFPVHFVSLERIATYEKKIPQNIEFIAIVFLRMVLPVDVLSYALGFFSTISFARYMAATVIGITPFAVIFAYGGSSLFEGRYVVFSATVAFSLAIFIVAVHCNISCNSKIIMAKVYSQRNGS